MSTPEQPSVDWLDPARESCLIDGVRYRRESSLAVEKLLAEWEGEYVDMVFRSRMIRDLRAALEADREGREGYEEVAVVPIRGGWMRAARLEEDAVKILVPTASPEDKYENAVHCKACGIVSHWLPTGDPIPMGPQDWTCPNCASPEPDKETP